MNREQRDFFTFLKHSLWYYPIVWIFSSIDDETRRDREALKSLKKKTKTWEVGFYVSKKIFALIWSKQRVCRVGELFFSPFFFFSYSRRRNHETFAADSESSRFDETNRVCKRGIFMYLQHSRTKIASRNVENIDFSVFRLTKM
jgi:hypothetical protein